MLDGFSFLAGEFLLSLHYPSVSGVGSHRLGETNEWLDTLSADKTPTNRKFDYPVKQRDHTILAYKVFSRRISSLWTLEVKYAPSTVYYFIQSQWYNQLDFSSSPSCDVMSPTVLITMSFNSLWSKTLRSLGMIWYVKPQSAIHTEGFDTSRPGRRLMSG